MMLKTLSSYFLRMAARPAAFPINPKENKKGERKGKETETVLAS